LECHLSCSHGWGIDCEVVGAEVVDRKVLHGWVRKKVPRARAGAVENCCWKL
jgi:hypothetical protein